MFDDARVVDNTTTTLTNRTGTLLAARVYEQRSISIEDKIAVQIFKWFTITFLVVGTVCNVLAAIVYSKKKMRKTSYSVYLFTLAVVDICVIWTGNLRLTLMFNVDLTTSEPTETLLLDELFVSDLTLGNLSATRWIKNATYLSASSSLVIDDGLIWSGFDLRLTSLAACRIHRFLTYYFLQLSSLLLCLLNIDRLVGCVLILKASQFCKPRTARRVVVYTMCFLFVLNLHFLCFMGVRNDQHLHPDTSPSNRTYVPLHQQRARVLCEPDTRDRAYLAFWNVFFYVDATLYCFIPFVIMIVCNALIIRKIIQSRKSSKKVIVKKSTQKILRHTSSGMLPTEKRLSLILIGISMSFLVFTVPVMIIEHLDEVLGSVTVGWNILLAVAYMLMYLNHVINFFFYCFMGPKFRNEIKKLFPMIFRNVAKHKTRCHPSRSNTGITLVDNTATTTMATTTTATSSGMTRLTVRLCRMAGQSLPQSVTQIQLIEKIDENEPLPVDHEATEQRQSTVSDL